MIWGVALLCGIFAVQALAVYTVRCEERQCDARRAPEWSSENRGRPSPGGGRPANPPWLVGRHPQREAVAERESATACWGVPDG